METRTSPNPRVRLATPDAYFLNHRIAPCGLSYQQCALYCNFNLPTLHCRDDDFKQHFLAEHSAFYSQKAVARYSELDGGQDLVFSNTDLTRDRLATLQAEVLNLCNSSLSQHCDRCLSRNYGYLEILHATAMKRYFVCSRCSFYSEDVERVKRHLIFQHLIIIRVVPLDHLNELVSVTDLPPLRINTPRFWKSGDVSEVGTSSVRPAEVLGCGNDAKIRRLM